MSDRIQKELELLRRYYPQVEWHPKEPGSQVGWIRILEYSIGCDLWHKDKLIICFEVTTAYPGGAPYAFYVEQGLLLKDGTTKPSSNYTETTETPFGGVWGKFSWQQEDSWTPTTDVVTGNNLTSFARSFHERFSQGA